MQTWSFTNLPLSSQIQTHIFRVYAQMVQMLLLSAASCFVSLHSSHWLLSSLSNFSFLGLIASLFGFYFTDELRNSTRARCWLAAFSVFKGLALAPLIDLVVDVNPTILVSSLITTTLLFASLSLAVLFSPRPSQIYITGLLLTMISASFWLTLVNWFVGSELLFTMELWLGLGMFSLYVIYDTQFMIQKAQQGQKTVLRHALELYMDFISLLVRILILLLKKDDKEKKKKR